VVNVELTNVDWLESAVLAVVLLVGCVWVEEFVIGLDVNGLALVSTAKGFCIFVSKFDSSWATD